MHSAVRLVFRAVGPFGRAWSLCLATVSLALHRAVVGGRSCSWHIESCDLVEPHQSMINLKGKS